MDYLDRFSITFGSLPEGDHEFGFEIDDKFFEQFDNPELKQGFCDITIALNKRRHMLVLEFAMDGSVTVPCSRCGEDMDMEIAGENELVVKFGEEEGEEAANVLVISAKEHELNVAHYIYEFISLLIPLRSVHPADADGQSACNPDTLKKLYSLTHHEEEDKETSRPDPRWDILKNINLN